MPPSVNPSSRRFELTPLAWGGGAPRGFESCSRSTGAVSNRFDAAFEAETIVPSSSLVPASDISGHACQPSANVRWPAPVSPSLGFRKLNEDGTTGRVCLPFRSEKSSGSHNLWRCRRLRSASSAHLLSFVCLP
jgi:hypothetical protein